MVIGAHISKKDSTLWSTSPSGEEGGEGDTEGGGGGGKNLPMKSLFKVSPFGCPSGLHDASREIFHKNDDRVAGPIPPQSEGRR
jgi:hypothetical protein